MNAQEDAGGCWFCALKMHYLTKILQSHKNHLFTLQVIASLPTLFFNIKVDIKAKRSLKCL